MAGAQLGYHWGIDRTAVHDEGTTGMEAAAFGWIERRRHFAGQDHFLLLKIRVRRQSAAHQPLGVRMGGVFVPVPHRRKLHYLPQVHHCDFVAHLGHDAKVVGDKDQSQVGLPLEFLEQLQILGLNGLLLATW